jgi:uncharacterized damage-inducible protein DinB
MYLHQQYSFVRSSRQVLLEYCQQISQADLLKENSSFGRGSIRNLLVHIGNTYQFWIGKHGLNLTLNFTPYQSVNTVSEVDSLFSGIDFLVEKFIARSAENPLEEFILEINGQPIAASPLKLFSHVITHEYHHKGQILSLSRHLGYVPADTDIFR